MRKAKRDVNGGKLKQIIVCMKINCIACDLFWATESNKAKKLLKLLCGIYVNQQNFTDRQHQRLIINTSTRRLHLRTPGLISVTSAKFNHAAASSRVKRLQLMQHYGRYWSHNLLGLYKYNRVWP